MSALEQDVAVVMIQSWLIGGGGVLAVELKCG
jgi:hypothetical protein